MSLKTKWASPTSASLIFGELCLSGILSIAQGPIWAGALEPPGSYPSLTAPATSDLAMVPADTALSPCPRRTWHL